MNDELLNEILEKIGLSEKPCSKIVFVSVLDEKCLVEVIKSLTEFIDHNLQFQALHNIAVTGIWSFDSFENKVFDVLADDISKMIVVYMYSESNIIEVLCTHLSPNQLAKISYVDSLINSYQITDESNVVATSDKFKSKQMYASVRDELNKAIASCANHSELRKCKNMYEKIFILVEAMYDFEENEFRINSVSAERLMLAINKLCTFHIQNDGISAECIVHCRNVLKLLTDILTHSEYTKAVTDSLAKLQYFTKMINARYFKSVMNL